MGYVAEAGATPSLRAGTLLPYGISLPGGWKQLPVNNAISGNYCQPRCDEATTEQLFGNPSQGNLRIIIIPTTKLMIQGKNPTIEEVGTATNLLKGIGSAITGSVDVEPEDIVSTETQTIDGKGYYVYNLLTPEANYGLHNVAAATT